MKLFVTASNTLLITNLSVLPVKSDGTSMITFIPGMDQCGNDTITVSLFDSVTLRSKEYKTLIDVQNPTGSCFPDKLEYTGSGEFAVYPNPASELAQLVLPDGHGTTIEISDLNGRLIKVYEISLSRNELTIDVGGFEPGIYMISELNLNIHKKMLIR